MSRRNVDEWDHGIRPKPRDDGWNDTPLFDGETGAAPPPMPPRDLESAETRKARILSNLDTPTTDDGAKRRAWIDRIHDALVRQLAARGYDGIVSANEARAVYLTFPDADPSVDFRFLAALWRRSGWVFADWGATSSAPGTHARRIAQYRFDPALAAERAESAA